MNQLPRHLFAKPPRKSVCQDAAKTVEPKLDDTQCGFRRGRSTTEQFPLSSKFSRNPGSMPKTSTHALSTWGKYMAGFLVKSFGGVVGVWCWRVPLAGRQVHPCSEDCFSVDGVKSQPFSVGVGLRQWCVLSPLLFIVYIRVLHTTARGTKPTCEAISLGRKTHFANDEKKICEKCVDLAEWNISRKNHVTQDVWLSNCCAIAYVVLSQINLKSTGLHKLHRQSQKRRRGCHC